MVQWLVLESLILLVLLAIPVRLRVGPTRYSADPSGLFLREKSNTDFKFCRAALTGHDRQFSEAESYF